MEIETWPCIKQLILKTLFLKDKDKSFLLLPTEKILRKAWFGASNRKNKVLKKVFTVNYFCKELHSEYTSDNIKQTSEIMSLSVANTRTMFAKSSILEL